MRTEKMRVDALFAAIPALLFTFCALFVVLIGEQVYENIIARNEENYAGATALAYVTNKIRQNDIAGGVELRPFGDREALILRETVGDRVYETYIYSLDGHICELYCESGSGLTPEDGERVLKGEIAFERLSDRLVWIRTDGGGAAVMLRSGGLTDDE